jgi:hypothetical protein
VKFRIDLPRRHSLLSQLLLVVCLLFAQATAYSHVVSHFTSRDHASGSPDATTQLCSQCLSGASLLSTGGIPDIRPLYREPPDISPASSRPVTGFNPRHYSAFRSRAPPSPP